MQALNQPVPVFDLPGINLDTIEAGHHGAELLPIAPGGNEQKSRGPVELLNLLIAERFHKRLVFPNRFSVGYFNVDIGFVFTDNLRRPFENLQPHLLHVDFDDGHRAVVVQIIQGEHLHAAVRFFLKVRGTQVIDICYYRLPAPPLTAGGNRHRLHQIGHSIYLDIPFEDLKALRQRFECYNSQPAYFAQKNRVVSNIGANVKSDCARKSPRVYVLEHLRFVESPFPRNCPLNMVVRVRKIELHFFAVRGECELT